MSELRVMPMVMGWKEAKDSAKDLRQHRDQWVRRKTGVYAAGGHVKKYTQISWMTEKVTFL